MMNVGGYNSITGFYANEIASRQKSKEEGTVQKKERADSAKGVSAAETAKANEEKLSDKAKEFLKNLREANSDFDFFIAGDNDDVQGMFEGSNKEFSVALSNEDIERMANDDEYAQKMLGAAGEALDMSDRIAGQLGLEDKGISITKIGVNVNADGSMSIFAELEKSAEKQRERIEQIREKRAEEQKEAKDTDSQESVQAEQKNHKLGRYGSEHTLRTTIEALTEDEMIDKIANFDWSKVMADQTQVGSRFDSAI